MTQVVKKNNKHNREQQIQDPPQVKQEDTVQQGDSFEAQFDEEAGAVEFELVDGTSITIKEPKAKAFLLMNSWMQNASEEYKSDQFAAMKLAHSCMVNYSHPEKGNKIPTFDEFLDELEVEDIERVGAALGCFRNVFDRLADKAASISGTK
jgi:hypothetical protein